MDTEKIIEALATSGKLDKMTPEQLEVVFKELGVDTDTWVDKTRKFFTGEGSKEFDYPDFDAAYLDPKYKPLGLDRKGMKIEGNIAPDPELTIGYNMATDDERRLQIIKEHRPDLIDSARIDKHGNVYVTNGGKQFYINRPGASGQDLRSGAGAVLASLPGTGAVSKGLQSENMVVRGGSAALAGASGSVLQDIAAKNAGAKVGVSPSNALMAAGISGGTVFAWPLIKALGLPTYQKVFGTKMVANGKFSTEGTEILRKAGIDPDSLTQEERIEMGRLMAEAADPKAAAAVAEADMLPERVPLTRGQATGERADQAVEYQIRDSLMGPDAKTSMDAFDERARRAIMANLQNLRSRIAGGPPLDDRDEAAGAAAKELQRGYKEAKTEYQNLYGAAEDAAPAFVTAPNRFRTAYMEDPEIVQEIPHNERLRSIVDDFEKMMGGEGVGMPPPPDFTPDVNSLFDWRKRLNAKMRGATPEESRALGKLKGKFDAFMKQSVMDDLVRGDPAAIDAWSKAIKSRADFGTKYQNDDVIQRLTEIDPKTKEPFINDPHAAGNLIFNGQTTGFISNSGALKAMKLLKKNLPPEHWNAVRQDMLLRMLGMTRDQIDNLAAGAGQMPTAAAFKKSVDKFKTSNKTLYHFMFDEGERNLISRIANTWGRVTMPRQGASNPSGSALWAGQMGQRVMQGPMGSAMREVLSVLHPLAKWYLPGVKGQYNFSKATGGGEGFVAPSAVSRPLPAPVAPATGAIGAPDARKLLEKYTDE
jgi:hypothetical protein